MFQFYINIECGGRLVGSQIDLEIDIQLFFRISALELIYNGQSHINVKSYS